MSRVLEKELEKELEKAAKSCKAKTGAGCDGGHLKVPLDLRRETRGEVVGLLEKVEQCWRWPQQACTTMFFLIPKSVTIVPPVAFLLEMIR